MLRLGNQGKMPVAPADAMLDTPQAPLAVFPAPRLARPNVCPFWSTNSRFSGKGGPSTGKVGNLRIPGNAKTAPNRP